MNRTEAELVKANARAERYKELLRRLQAVANHGSVRSGALQYIRDQLKEVNLDD